MTLPNTPPPRLPSIIWKELRKKLKRMNNGVKFPDYKTGEVCAFDIQRLQKEFKFSKECYIRLAPLEQTITPLVNLFPKGNTT